LNSYDVVPPFETVVAIAYARRAQYIPETVVAIAYAGGLDGVRSTRSTRG